jgi:hypothetical protein
MSKISGYANSVSALGTDDLIDVSEKISTSPDVYESRKMTGAILAAFIQAYAQNILANDGLTMPANRSHDLQNFVLTLQNAGFAIEGAQTITAGAAGSVDILNLYDNASALLHRFNSTFISLFGGGVPGGSEKLLIGDKTKITDRLDLSTTTDGFLMPRLTTAQMNAIAAPTTNLLIFNTDLSAIYRYNGAAWVALSAGYGVISVSDSNGIPTFYADLQSALETCKTSGGIFTVKLHSNITITSTISIKSTGTGTGNAYAFDTLTIDLNGYEVKNDNADSTYCFDLLLSSSLGVNRTLLFKNGKITRTSGTGTHYAIYLTQTGNYGTLLFEKCIVYGENSYGAYIGMQQSTDRLYDINDFGGSLFISDSSYGLYVRNYNCKNFSVLGKSSTSSAYLRNCTTQNYTVENTSTGIGLTMVGNISSSDFRVKSTTGKGLYCADDVSGDISNFVVETTTGDGIETTGTNPTYKPVFNNFTIICGNGVCIDSNHTNTEFNNFYLRNNGTSKTISEVNNGTRQYTNGSVINLGSGQSFDITNVGNVKFTNIKFISTSECVGSISLDNSIFNVDFELCSFECNYDDATGNGIEISNSTGLIDISLSKFKVENASANALYATASRTLNFTNNYVKGATTPINANITVTASTDLGDGNRSY